MVDRLCLRLMGLFRMLSLENVVELVLDIRPDDDDDDDDKCLKIPHSESLKVLDVAANGCRLKCQTWMLISISIKLDLIFFFLCLLKLVSARNGNLPLLPYLTKLELHVTARSWILVLHWLQSCSNLKVLSVIISDFPPYKFKEAVPDFVPLCLSSCIKEIEIKKHGKVDLEKMLIYLLDNAKVLNNLTVDSRVYIKDSISRVVG